MTMGLGRGRVPRSGTRAAYRKVHILLLVCKVVGNAQHPLAQPQALEWRQYQHLAHAQPQLVRVRPEIVTGHEAHLRHASMIAG